MKIKDLIKEGLLNMGACIFKAYEVQNYVVTGYKVFYREKQIGTLEYRDGKWIAGIMLEGASKPKIFNCDRLTQAWRKFEELVLSA